MKMRISTSMHVCGNCAYYTGNQNPDMLLTTNECDDTGTCLETTRRNFPVQSMQTCPKFKSRF